MLKVTYVRDGKNQIIGDKTSGFANDDNVARDQHGRILGHANSTFHNTRDSQGHLVSTNQANADLLFNW